MLDLTPARNTLEPIEIASRDEITALQLSRMKWTLNHAYTNVPHYKAAFDAAGVHPDDKFDCLVDPGEPFYFVHSFVPRPESGQLLASAQYGDRFAAVVGRPPVYGAQFHPEKSSAAGLLLLANFIAICERHGNGVATTTAALGSG